MREVAIVVPTYVRSEEDFDVVERMLISLRQHEPEVRCIVVDDASPELSTGLLEMANDYGCEVVFEKENRGFSTTVNVGIRLAMEAGQDVILANSDLEFRVPFVEMMSKQQRLDGSGPAEVVGALLVYPEPRGLIAHGGIYFSVLTRTFHHMFQFAPEDLLEAQQAAVRPCTGALQLVRYDVFKEVGLYDESYFLGWEDVDLNVRVLRAGGQVVYQPLIRAWHGESIFRGQANEKITRWTRESWAYFRRKWKDENFIHWVPTF